MPLYGGKAYLRILEEFELAVRLRMMKIDSDLRNMVEVAAGAQKNPNWEDVVCTRNRNRSTRGAW